MYDRVRAVQQETDKTAFIPLLKKLLDELNDDADTRDFCTYFKESFAPKASSWAYCFRMHSGLNTNMHLERVHCTIKHYYLKTKRLDKALNSLMKFVRDKLFDGLLILDKVKLSSRIRELKKRHETSLAMDSSLITKQDNTWQIPSSSKIPEAYTIYKNDLECRCQIVCAGCRTCIHKYSCSCADSAISWNMCKHIHLLCRHLGLQAEQNEEQKGEAGDTDNKGIFETLLLG